MRITPSDGSFVLVLLAITVLGCGPTGPESTPAQTGALPPVPETVLIHKEWSGVFPTPSQYGYSFSDRSDFELQSVGTVSVAMPADCDTSATYPHLIFGVESVTDKTLNVYTALDSPVRDASDTAHFPPGSYQARVWVTGSWPGCAWRMILETRAVQVTHAHTDAAIHAPTKKPTAEKIATDRGAGK